MSSEVLPCLKRSYAEGQSLVPSVLPSTPTTDVLNVEVYMSSAGELVTTFLLSGVSDWVFRPRAGSSEALLRSDCRHVSRWAVVDALIVFHGARETMR